MASQGKCVKCRIRYVWRTKRPLKKTFCPCGQKLQQTNIQSEFPVVNLDDHIERCKKS